VDGVVRKEPNLEVQQRLDLIFSTFLQQRSASKVLQFFNAQHLLLPRHDRFGDVRWRKPTVAAILAILKNPAYAARLCMVGRGRCGPGRDHAKQRKRNCLWSNGASASTTSTLLTLAGRPMSRSRRCSKTTMPSMTAIRRAAFHAPERLCYMAGLLRGVRP